MRQSRIYDNNDGILQIGLESPGCVYSKNGHCKMCYYGSGQKIDAAEAVATVKRALENYPNPTGILIGSFGSPLDEAEVDRNVLQAALREVAKHKTKDIFIETHCNTITADSLRFLMDNLPQKTISIEMGLESSNENVLKNVINKNLSLKKLSDTIELIHSHGMRVVLNVLYGLWYDKQEMQQDFLDTCHWADSHGADEIIAFLINVKPGTYVEKLFNEGNFVLPSHREFISTLSKLSDQILCKTYFSWFGERQYRGLRLECIPPDYDGLAPEAVMRFYHDFMEATDITTRRALIKDILSP